MLLEPQGLRPGDPLPGAGRRVADELLEAAGERAFEVGEIRAGAREVVYV